MKQVPKLILAPQPIIYHCFRPFKNVNIFFFGCSEVYVHLRKQSIDCLGVTLLAFTLNRGEREKGREFNNK